MPGLFPQSIHVDSTPRHVSADKPKRRRRNRNQQQKNNYNSSTDTSSVSSGDGHHVVTRKAAHKKAHLQPVSTEEKSRYLALDCEMVGLGENGQRSSLARVVVTDWDGDLVLDLYVKQVHEVTDYRTHVSGITAEHLVNAIDIDDCRAQVSALVKGKILVGHALKNDFSALGLKHNWAQIRDTAKYEPFMKVRFDDQVLWPRKLKDLATEKLQREIQTGIHCPMEDARTAMDLYIKARYKWEKAMTYKINKTKEIEERKRLASQ